VHQACAYTSTYVCTNKEVCLHRHQVNVVCPIARTHVQTDRCACIGIRKHSLPNCTYTCTHREVCLHVHQDTYSAHIQGACTHTHKHTRAHRHTHRGMDTCGWYTKWHTVWRTINQVQSESRLQAIRFPDNSMLARAAALRLQLAST
jgi:hypothetical protein